jgi:pimeloyl-ACP methyl ester carboxylesterase
VAAPSLIAADGGVIARPQATPSYIVVGFVGGFVRHNSLQHGPVQLAQRIERTVPKDAYVQVFENRHRKTAYKTILNLLDLNHDGILSNDEKAAARIILYGHSWGASAAVLLARDLDRLGIPVLLTAQVDSVAKPWQNDAVIPQNVASAVNFYQPHGLIHGRAQIIAAVPSKTQVLGNFRFDYRKEPVKCDGAPWFARTFMPSHIESECDMHLWTQVEALVLQRMQPEPGTVAALPLPMAGR